MSIYRKPSTDLFVEPAAEPLMPWEQGPVDADAADARAAAEQEAAERRLRRGGEPFNELLPRTREWAAHLPSDVVPHELMRVYPRIANTLASDWHEQDATRAYFSDLLNSHRAARHGFGEPIRAELVRLKRHYYAVLDAKSVSAWHGLRNP